MRFAAQSSSFFGFSMCRCAWNWLIDIDSFSLMRCITVVYVYDVLSFIFMCHVLSLSFVYRLDCVWHIPTHHSIIELVYIYIKTLYPKNPPHINQYTQMYNAHRNTPTHTYGIFEKARDGIRCMCVCVLFSIWQVWTRWFTYELGKSISLVAAWINCKVTSERWYIEKDGDRQLRNEIEKDRECASNRR